MCAQCSGAACWWLACVVFGVTWRGLHGSSGAEGRMSKAESLGAFACHSCDSACTKSRHAYNGSAWHTLLTTLLPSQKEELPEKSARMFKDVKGCDEAKDELMEVCDACCCFLCEDSCCSG